MAGPRGASFMILRQYESCLLEKMHATIIGSGNEGRWIRYYRGLMPDEDTERREQLCEYAAHIITSQYENLSDLTVEVGKSNKGRNYFAYDASGMAEAGPVSFRVDVTMARSDLSQQYAEYSDHL